MPQHGLPLCPQALLLLLLRRPRLLHADQEL
jgi:hypothetical protein